MLWSHGPIKSVVNQRFRAVIGVGVKKKTHQATVEGFKSKTVTPIVYYRYIVLVEFSLEISNVFHPEILS